MFGLLGPTSIFVGETVPTEKETEMGTETETTDASMATALVTTPVRPIAMASREVGKAEAVRRISPAAAAQASSHSR